MAKPSAQLKRGVKKAASSNPPGVSFDLDSYLEKQRREQGLPPRITDPAALRAIARLLGGGRDG